MRDPLPIFVACLPGLEPILEAELSGLSVKGTRVTAGGVEGEADAATFLRIHLESGVATHVLVRVASFRARAISELRRKVEALDLGLWLDAAGTHPIRATSRRSRLFHTGAIERECATVLSSRGLRCAPGTSREFDPRRPTLRVRIERDEVTLSIDTTGEPLHRRGWRLESGKAPLREDLAHALLLASGWDRESPLLDPFTGSGTIVIEAARLARRIPPGKEREFAFLGFQAFDAALWKQVQAHATSRILPSLPSSLVGTDRNDGAIAHARANAERADVLADLVLERRALADAPLPERTPSAIVTNPPYGHRLGDPRELLPLYQTLGRRLRELPTGSRVALLAAHRKLAYATGVRWRSLFQTTTGGLAVHAFGHEAIGSAERSDSSTPKTDSDTP